jgi:hypothetical protein
MPVMLYAWLSADGVAKSREYKMIYLEIANFASTPTSYCRHKTDKDWRKQVFAVFNSVAV